MQFRRASLDVDQSNPVNKDFENMIDKEEGELFQNVLLQMMIFDPGQVMTLSTVCNWMRSRVKAWICS